MKNLLITAALSCMLVACGEQAQQTEQKEVVQEQAAKTYSAADFFSTTSFRASNAAGHAFSSDGKNILVTSDETGVFNAFATNIQTGERTQLTQSEGSAHYGVSYFPADDRILVTADNGGDELNHIWVRELDGTLRDLTNTENTKASFGGWSKDGSEFYIQTNERDAKAFDLYAYKTEGYGRRMVYENSDALFLSGMSNDGRWLALTKSRTSADSNVYLVDLVEGGAPKLITEHEGNIAYGVYGFTPDSSQLILSTNEHGEFNQAWAYTLADGAKNEYASADWDVSFVGFSNTGRYKYVGVNADATTVISITDLENGTEVTLPKMVGNIQNPRFSADDSQLAFMLNGDRSPSDLYVAAFGSEMSAPKRLTTSLNPEIDQNDLVEATVIRYESFDGVKIPSILYKPKGASAENKVPALVFVHGGPGGQTRRGYRAMFQHLVNHGYAVLGANNRGSSGYGKTFFHMDDKKHGEDDLQDIVMGRKYLESLDWVDGSKVGIIGGSYGGYMTAAALAFEPEAFEVGINIFGVTNWVRTLKSIPPWWESFRESLYDEMGDPATDEERHRRISPLFHAQNIVKPLLVVQGANDPRVLQVESDELVAAVKANGVPVEYVLFPDEGHGFRSKANRITASEAYVKFLDTHLKNKAN
ncbi:MAG: alpha/beta fold hydrolase [Kordiimonas sp.]